LDFLLAVISLVMHTTVQLIAGNDVSLICAVVCVEWDVELFFADTANGFCHLIVNVLMLIVF